MTLPTRTFIAADIAIDKTIVQQAIENQCGFTPHTITLLREGYDNAVFLIDHRLIFRFPRRHRSAELLLREINLLSQMKGNLPLKIPMPLFVGNQGASFSFPFYGYEYLPGTCGCTIDLSSKEYECAAIKLGSFLKHLHGQDTGLIRHEPTFDRIDFSKVVKMLESRFLEMRQTYDLNKYDGKVEEICADASKYQHALKPSVIVHGDLYHRHLLFNDNELTAIIDWGEHCLSDPSIDIGVLWQFFPQKFHEYFFKSYGDIPPTTLHYARFVALYYAAALLSFGDDRKDQDLIRTSLETFKNI